MTKKIDWTKPLRSAKNHSVRWDYIGLITTMETEYCHVLINPNNGAVVRANDAGYSRNLGADVYVENAPVEYVGYAAIILWHNAPPATARQCFIRDTADDRDDYLARYKGCFTVLKTFTINEAL